MRYIGGKARIAKDIAKIITETDGQYQKYRRRVIVEPFCGALNVSVELIKLDPNVIILASDIDTNLIVMWEEIQKGWKPPKTVTKERYLELKNSQSCPERTFVGYGCSFSGKWFGGYASDNNDRNYALNAANSIEKIRPYLKSMIFNCGPYEDQEYLDDCAIYCDPPYQGTTKPGTRGEFNSKDFFEWVTKVPQKCYVSEYNAPGLLEVWQKSVKTDMHTKTGKDSRVEKLFVNR